MEPGRGGEEVGHYVVRQLPAAPGFREGDTCRRAEASQVVGHRAQERVDRGKCVGGPHARLAERRAFRQEPRDLWSAHGEIRRRRADLPRCRHNGITEHSRHPGRVGRRVHDEVGVDRDGSSGDEEHRGSRRCIIAYASSYWREVRLPVNASPTARSLTHCSLTRVIRVHVPVPVAPAICVADPPGYTRRIARDTPSVRQRGSLRA